MAQVEVRNFIVGIIAAGISLCGFAVAIWQIRKTRKAAEAATDAAKEIQGILAKNVMLADTTKIIGEIREVKAFILNERYDAALVKMQEFQSNLVELRHLSGESASLSGQSFQAIFSNLSVINDTLEEKVIEPESRFDIQKTNKILSGVILVLQDWLGSGKYEVMKE